VVTGVELDDDFPRDVKICVEKIKHFEDQLRELDNKVQSEMFI
jgi:hypothetical protein